MFTTSGHSAKLNFYPGLSSQTNQQLSQASARNSYGYQNMCIYTDNQHKFNIPSFLACFQVVKRNFRIQWLSQFTEGRSISCQGPDLSLSRTSQRWLQDRWQGTTASVSDFSMCIAAARKSKPRLWVSGGGCYSNPLCMDLNPPFPRRRHFSNTPSL